MGDQKLILPRSVTVAQVILDHFVMVRIHARQPVDDQRLTGSSPNCGDRGVFVDGYPH